MRMGFGVRGLGRKAALQVLIKLLNLRGLPDLARPQVFIPEGSQKAGLVALLEGHIG